MKNLFKSISLIAFAFLFSTCSLSDFGDVNKNPNATTVPVTSALLTNVLSGLGGWTQGMNEGLYAQYFPSLNILMLHCTHCSKSILQVIIPGLCMTCRILLITTLTKRLKMK